MTWGAVEEITGQRNRGGASAPLRQFCYRFTISVELMDIPFAVAVMVTEVFVRTLRVCIVKVAVVTPLGTVTLLGTDTIVELLLVSVTTTPVPAETVTVPLAIFPPWTIVGERVSAVGMGDAATG